MFATGITNPLSFEVCKEYALQFDRLYEAEDIKDSTAYPHPNPMKRNSNSDLSLKATLNDFFNDIQFPVGYSFDQNSQGIVNRTFREPAFNGDQSASLHERKFSLVNSKTKKALSVPRENGALIFSNFDKSNSGMQFKVCALFFKNIFYINQGSYHLTKDSIV